MQPTDEQQAVIDACASGVNLKVEAGAGAGKTSTLRLAAGRMLARLARQAPSSRRSRLLYVVYNKQAATEAKRSFPQGVRAVTIHGLAFGVVGRDYEARLNAPRLSNKQIALRLGVRNPVELNPTVRLTPAGIAQSAMLTVQRFCESADQEIGLQHLPALRGMNTTAQLGQMYVEWLQLRNSGDRAQAAELRSLWDNEMRLRRDLAAVVLPVAQRAWEDLQDPRGDQVRFTPDVYLKLFQLTKPRLSYDVVMLDEAQDSNPVTASILQSQQDAQLIAIGDSCQQLYGWRGAVDALATWPADKHLFLQRSFRFGPQIAAEANKWLAVLGATLRVKGNPALDSVVGPIDEPTAVLCRSNGGAIAQLMTALDAGRKPALAGGAGELTRLVEAAEQLLAGQPTDHSELFMFTTWAEVREHSEEGTGSDLRVFVKLVDEHGPKAMLKALRQVTDESGADVVISTAHKSKGLEFPTVLIHDDYPEPKTQGGRVGVVPRQDAMLAYVAVTRAKVGLDRTGLAWVDHYTPLVGAA